MRWDIIEEKRAVRHWEDSKQWARIADALGPTVPTGPTYDNELAWEKLMASGYGQPTKDGDLARDIQTRLLPLRRKARNDFKVGAGLQPFPVYVAKFQDGSTQRLSFWSRAGKPLDFAAGFNVSLVIGRGVPVSGHVESGGGAHIDPHFNSGMTVTVTEKGRNASAAMRLAAICKALNEGEIEAAMMMARVA